MKQYSSDFSYYTNRSIDEIVKEFSVSVDRGLDTQEIAQRRSLYGANTITVPQMSTIVRLAHQFNSPFIYLLFAAALISFGFKNHVEGLVILFIIVLNGLIGFYQEYKANKAIQFLKKYLISYTRVIRNGQEIKVLKEELVPGDIVVLYPGDIIPADVRFLMEQNIMVDESIITGESVPVKKMVDPSVEPIREMFQATMIGFAGTTVTRGKGKALVYATGIHSTLGMITKLTVSTQRTSSFAKIISRFSKFALYLMAISLTIIFVMNLIIKRGDIDIIDLLLFSAALAVSVVPEALPIITTFALSQGAMHLARQKTVVKRLSAIEDLGNIEILCTDKTGTLTENILVVKEVYGNHHRLPVFYAAAATSFVGKSVATLKGFERALYLFLSADEKKDLASFERVVEFPFDPLRKSNAAIVKKESQHELVVSGMMEHVLERCSNLGEKERQNILDWSQDQGYKGHRVLAIARKKLENFNVDHYAGFDASLDLQLLGAISFEDPLKKTAAQAVQKAQRFGIQCKIISGDAPEVCGAIAYKVGLINDIKLVLTGMELEKQSPEQQRESVKKFHVFARVSPEQKYHIIKLLQEQHEVGYVGDGINDAPALKQASVAIAVHDAADIAREAADIIVLEKSLLVIINGIVEGRKIFANTLKYLRATLSSNFGNFYAVAITSLFTKTLPMLPSQILLVNVISDFPLISLATDNVGNDQLDRAAQYDTKEITVLATILGLVSTLFDFIFFALFFAISVPVLQTGWFIGSCLTELVFLISIRTKHLFFRGSRPSWILATLTMLAAVVTVAIPYTSFGHYFFNFTSLPCRYLAWIIGVTLAYFVTTDVIKVLFYRMYNNHQLKKRA